MCYCECAVSPQWSLCFDPDLVINAHVTSHLPGTATYTSVEQAAVRANPTRSKFELQRLQEELRQARFKDLSRQESAAPDVRRAPRGRHNKRRHARTGLLQKTAVACIEAHRCETGGDAVQTRGASTSATAADGWLPQASLHLDAASLPVHAPKDVNSLEYKMFESALAEAMGIVEEEDLVGAV